MSNGKQGTLAQLNLPVGTVVRLVNMGHRDDHKRVTPKRFGTVIECGSVKMDKPFFGHSEMYSINYDAVFEVVNDLTLNEVSLKIRGMIVAAKAEAYAEGFGDAINVLENSAQTENFKNPYRTS